MSDTGITTKKLIHWCERGLLILLAGVLGYGYYLADSKAKSLESDNEWLKKDLELTQAERTVREARLLVANDRLKEAETARDKSAALVNQKQREADAARWLAKTSKAKALAFESQLANKNAPERSLALAIEAATTEDNVHTRSALLEALSSRRHLRSFEDVTMTSVAPSSDLIAVASKKAPSTVINALTGKTVLAIDLHQSPCVIQTFSNSSRYLATSAQDATLAIWDLEKKSPIFKEKFDSTVTHVEFSSDDKFILVSTHGRATYLRETATGEKSVRYVGHKKSVKSAHFAGPSSVITYSLDGFVRMFDRTSGELTLEAEQVGSPANTSTLFHPNSERILLIDQDAKSIDVLDLQDLSSLGTINYEQVGQFKFRLESETNSAIVYHPEAKAFCSCSLADPTSKKPFAKLPEGAWNALFDKTGYTCQSQDDRLRRFDWKSKQIGSSLPTPSDHVL